MTLRILLPVLALLLAPAALAQVAVVTDGPGGVRTFDPFGAPGRTLPAPEGPAVAVSVAGDSVVVVSPRAVAVHGRGGRGRVARWAGPAPLVDATLVEGVLVGLTSTDLVGLDG